MKMVMKGIFLKLMLNILENYITFKMNCYFYLENENWKAEKILANKFSPVTSANVEISHQNFLNFSFNFFTTMM